MIIKLNILIMISNNYIKIYNKVKFLKKNINLFPKSLINPDFVFILLSKIFKPIHNLYYQLPNLCQFPIFIINIKLIN